MVLFFAALESIRGNLIPAYSRRNGWISMSSCPQARGRCSSLNSIGKEKHTGSPIKRQGLSRSAQQYRYRLSIEDKYCSELSRIDTSYAPGSARAFLTRGQEAVLIEQGSPLQHVINGASELVGENGHRLGLVVFSGFFLKPALRLWIAA